MAILVVRKHEIVLTCHDSHWPFNSLLIQNFNGQDALKSFLFKLASEVLCTLRKDGFHRTLENHFVRSFLKVEQPHHHDWVHEGRFSFLSFCIISHVWCVIGKWFLRLIIKGHHIANKNEDIWVLNKVSWLPWKNKALILQVKCTVNKGYKW